MSATVLKVTRMNHMTTNRLRMPGSALTVPGNNTTIHMKLVVDYSRMDMGSASLQALLNVMKTWKKLNEDITTLQDGNLIMADRIKQLAEQATTIEYGVDNGFDRVTFDKQKFADLIIEMCADHILSTSDRYRKEYFAAKVLELKNVR
jgi:hypothetical protein